MAKSPTRRIQTRFAPEAEVVLYPGDCRDLLSSLPDQSIRLIVTSPPYNIGKKYEKQIPLADYLGAQEQVIRECVRVLAKDGSLCWQGRKAIGAEPHPAYIEIARRRTALAMQGRLKTRPMNRPIYRPDAGRLVALGDVPLFPEPSIPRETTVEVS